jgi:hypothetical protein
VNWREVWDVVENTGEDEVVCELVEGAVGPLLEGECRGTGNSRCGVEHDETGDEDV